MKTIPENFVAADVSRLIIPLEKMERTHARCYTLEEVLDGVTTNQSMTLL